MVGMRLRAQRELLAQQRNLSAIGVAGAMRLARRGALLPDRQLGDDPRFVLASDPVRGKINIFSLDTLVNMASVAGLRIDMQIQPFPEA